MYLQFDGVTDDVYMKTRGEALLASKMKCIENCREAGMKIVFVPTIVKGLNDHQLGDILKVAIDNVDTVSGISFQPVAFTGRIAKKELEAKRFTLADLAHSLERADGYVRHLQRLVPALHGRAVQPADCGGREPWRPDHLRLIRSCSLGTYMFVDEKSRKAIPVTQFVDIPAMVQDIEEMSRKKFTGIMKYYNGAKGWMELKKHFKADRAPEGLTFEKFLNTIQGMTNKKLGRDGMDGTFTYRTLLVAGMHFQDNYNYDIERLKRCVIHYAAPDGKLYPFCAYNSGPTYREKIEKEFSIPFEKQLERFEFVELTPAK